LDDARVKGIDLSKIIPLFQQLGFRRYQHEVRKLALELGLVRGESALALQEEEGIAAAVDGSLAREGGAPASIPLPSEGLAGGEPQRGRYELILDRAQLQELVETLKKQELIAVDTETTGLDTSAGLCGLSFAWETGHGVYVPTLSPEKERHLDTETVLNALKAVLEDPAIKKCGHN